MATSFKRFVITQAVVIAAFNAGMNAFYTWWLWSSREELPLRGADNIGVDLAMTPVFIAVLSTLLGTMAIRQKLRDGRVVAPARALPAALYAAPQGLLQRTTVFGITATAMLSIPLWMMLRASGIEALPLSDAILSKVAITVAMSLLIVPLVILTALADVQLGNGCISTAPSTVLAIRSNSSSAKTVICCRPNASCRRPCSAMAGRNVSSSTAARPITRPSDLAILKTACEIDRDEH